MKKLLLIKALVLLTLIFTSYFIGYKQALKTNERFKKEIEEETLKNNPIPKCDSGKCPEYQSFDVDGDGKPEDIVTEYFGMSQFAGRVMVIDEGKVVFISKGEMFISVRPTKEYENENGFIVTYSTVPNARSNKDLRQEYYKYIDGKYFLQEDTAETNSDELTPIPITK